MLSIQRFVTFYIPLYLKKAENGGKFLETKTMVGGHDAADFGSPWNFLTLGVFLK